MRLVVGLGNPGREYADTRHNVGFRVVERFASRHAILLGERRFRGRFGAGRALGQDVAILEPLTYMNLSGRSVLEAVRAFELEDLARDLLVVFDDVDLPFGRLRVRASGGAGGHKGLGDLIDRLRRNDFPRLRFGVGRPSTGQDTADYVLSPFDVEETAALDERLDEAADALEAVLVEGVEAAMNRFNAPARAASEAG